MSTQSIPTKDVAKLIREALRAAFPGTKFSVRCGTGTGSSWISVHYTDGPLDRDVDQIVNRYQGHKFNGMTDGYDDLGDDLVLFPGNEMPTQVRFYCDGVNTSRSISDTATDWAVELVRSARKNHAMTWQDRADDSDEMRHGDVLFFNGRGIPYYGAVMHVNEPAVKYGALRYYAELVAHQFDLTDARVPDEATR